VLALLARGAELGHALRGRCREILRVAGALFTFVDVEGIGPTSRVGGRRGGVQEGPSVAAPFGWRCLTRRSITPFPAPATSNRTGGFPASGSPRRRLHIGVMVPFAGPLAFATA
jgi:hypothetical protein